LVTLAVMMSGNGQGCCCGVAGGLLLLLHAQLQTFGGGDAGAGRRVAHSGCLLLLHDLGQLDGSPEAAAVDMVVGVAAQMLPSLLNGSGQATGLMEPLQLLP
jgi:hypothetical protein